VVSLPRDDWKGDFNAAKRSSDGSPLPLRRVSLSKETAFLVEVPTDGVLARLISTVKEGVVLWRTLILANLSLWR
jgi:hypothetical protein